MRCEDCKYIWKGKMKEIHSGEVVCPKCGSKRVIVYVEHRKAIE
jgi:Zn finger protein HypA/HybF involved in hydrogenase expression